MFVALIQVRERLRVWRDKSSSYCRWHRVQRTSVECMSAGGLSCEGRCVYKAATLTGISSSVRCKLYNSR